MAEPIQKALDSFIAEINKETFDVRAGDLFEADHPLVKKYAGMFGPITFRFPKTGRVEQATAAPGEKRTLSLRRKAKPKAAAKPEPKPEPKPAPEPSKPYSFVPSDDAYDIEKRGY